jgi:hypothetical protein
MSEPVRLAVVPNGAIAEMICSELEANGIRAFSRSSSPLAGGSMTSLDPGSPAEIWIAPEDLERAQAFLPADDD